MSKGKNQFDFEERPWTNKDFLMEEYYWNCKSLKEIAKPFPITKDTIHNWVKEYNIKRKYKDESWLKEEYLYKNNTAKEIAEKSNVSQATISNWINKLSIADRNKEKCPSCSEDFIHLSRHWGNSCEYPQLSNDQLEILSGILMGDGHLSDREIRTHPRFIIKMTNKPYLEYISESLFPIYSNGVFLSHNAEYNADRDRRSGWNESAKAEDYKNIFSLTLKTSPEFRCFTGWYKNKEKIFPEDISLTDKVLKHWYVCDGTISEVSNSKYVSITASNEYQNKSKIESIFDSSSAPNPSNFYITESKYMNLSWNKERTQEFFDYIGKPLPGFEYKWR